MSQKSEIRSAFASSFRLLRSMYDDMSDGGMIQEWVDNCREELSCKKFAEWTDEECGALLHELVDACRDDGLPAPFDTTLLN